MLGIEQYHVITMMAETQIKNLLDNAEPGSMNVCAAANGIFMLWDSIKSMTDPCIAVAVAADRARMVAVLQQATARHINAMLEDAQP